MSGVTVDFIIIGHINWANSATTDSTIDESISPQTGYQDFQWL